MISLFHYGPRFFGIGFTNFLAWLLRKRFAQRLLVKSVALRQPDTALLDSTLAGTEQEEKGGITAIRSFPLR
jgi:hypothetical protein